MLITAREKVTVAVGENDYNQNIEQLLNIIVTYSLLPTNPEAKLKIMINSVLGELRDMKSITRAKRGRMRPNTRKIARLRRLAKMRKWAFRWNQSFSFPKLQHTIWPKNCGGMWNHERSIESLSRWWPAASEQTKREDGEIVPFEITAPFSSAELKLAKHWKLIRERNPDHLLHTGICESTDLCSRTFFGPDDGI